MTTVLFALSAATLAAAMPAVLDAPNRPWRFWMLVPLGFFLAGAATFSLILGGGR